MNLEYEKINGYDGISADELKKIMDYSSQYADFLGKGKTEREACRESIKIAQSYGYEEKDYDYNLKKGDKVVYVNKNKCIAIVKVGTNDINKDGIKIVASHIDSPRLDIRQVPLYEEENTCYLRTHYYGGIKKYQWLTIPLSIHGVIMLKNGKFLTVNIGDKESDPIFYISDLLPHLSQKENEKTVSKAFSGEKLNLIIGGAKLSEESVKINVLKILNEKYGITEEDFLSSELEVVPSLMPRDVGFDRVYLAGYGHDDKVCAYPALTALLDSKSDKTSIVFLLDKEEIGSEGVSGAQSRFIGDVFDMVISCHNANPIKVRSRSKCISADVTASYDSNFSDVFEKSNSSLISHGVAMNKFTGARGKSGASDASCECVGYFRTLFDNNNIIWQTGELGKIDLGGGGTVAKYFANYNIDTVDLGVPVLSMHSPYELISKVDLYNAYKGFKVFFED